MAIKVLLIDDITFFLELEKNYLCNTDCDIFTASNGKDGLDVTTKVMPDIIFLDYEMPIMNGMEFLIAKENIEDIKGIPVIIVSSFVNASLQNLLFAHGAKEIIKKPFTKEEFLSIVNKYSPTDKRKKKRVIINMPAFYGFEDDMEKGVVLDISEKGLFLAANRLLKVGTYIEIKFLLPNNDKSLKLWARVIWINEGKNKKKENYPEGMGLEFVDLGKEMRQTLKELVERGQNGY